MGLVLPGSLFLGGVLLGCGESSSNDTADNGSTTSTGTANTSDGSGGAAVASNSSASSDTTASAAAGSDTSQGGTQGSGTSTSNSVSSGGSGADTSSVGGAAAGGAAAGGAAGGGTTAVGGTGHAGGGTTSQGGIGAQQCRNRNDCVLFQDCCTCAALSADSTPAMCRAACAEPACDAVGITSDDLSCVAGRCVLGRGCDDDYCQPEDCPAGQRPLADTSCEVCIPVEQCKEVPNCDVCEAAGLTCVDYGHQIGSVYHCVATPDDCEDSSDCECMGVCTGDYVCNSSERLYCTCPIC